MGSTLELGVPGEVSSWKVQALGLIGLIEAPCLGDA